MAISYLRAPTYGRTEQATVPSAPYHQSGVWEDAEHLYGAIGEKSIDFLKILYRLFRKTL